MSPPVKTVHVHRKYDHVLITGASGGIGSALARHYAAHAATLTLWGRDISRLNQLAQDCFRLGASTHVVSLDLSDVVASRSRLDEADARAPLDLIFFNAGVSDIRQPGEIVERPQVVMETALVNFAVPATLASSIADKMARRGGGSIVFTGSVAAWHELPFAAAYAASKSGLERFAGALRAAVGPSRVNVTLVALGFVDTRMSRRLEGYKPFLVTTETVVRRIARAVDQRRAMITFPRIFGFLRVLDALTPRVLVHWLLRSVKVNQVPREKVSS